MGQVRTMPPNGVVAPECGLSASKPSLRRLLIYFLRLGTFGFGGPIALGGLHAARFGGGASVKSHPVHSKGHPGFAGKPSEAWAATSAGPQPRIRNRAGGNPYKFLQNLG